MSLPGLNLIVPTSVAGTGVSVSSSGKVTYTSATSVAVNGCFTSDYDHYLVVIRHSAGGTVGQALRLRSSGTSATTNYNYQYISVDNASITALRITSTSLMRVGLAGSGQNASHCFFYNPFSATPTIMRSSPVSSYLSAYWEEYANYHSSSTSYDGFEFYPQSGSFTGMLTVYGLAK